jgi:hypothetical protein
MASRSIKGRRHHSLLAGAEATSPLLTYLDGLIELHNHLSYNALPLWSPRRMRLRQFCPELQNGEPKIDPN